MSGFLSLWTEQQRYSEIAALRHLQWEIQQQLHQLTSSVDTALLYKIAVLWKDEMEADWPGEDATNVEASAFVVDFISKQLRSLKYLGMANLSRRPHWWTAFTTNSCRRW